MKMHVKKSGKLFSFSILTNPKMFSILFQTTWEPCDQLLLCTSSTQWMTKLLIAICLTFTLPENWRVQFQSYLPREKVQSTPS